MEDLKTCHQCRQRTNKFVVSCNNLKKGKLCPLKYCSKCLLNRYIENAEEVERQNDWTCPKCRDICNCSCCRKRKGLRPTGKSFLSTSQIPEVRDLEIPDARGSETLDMQIDVIVEKEQTIVLDNSSYEKGFLSNVVSPDKPFSSKKEPENILVEKGDSSFDSREVQNTSSFTGNKRNQNDVINNGGENATKDIPLPLGTTLTNILNIELAPEDVGNTLQFLQFCKVFGEVIDVKEGEAEAILQELVRKQNLRRGENVLAIQFQIRLLTLVLQDLGNRSLSLSITDEKDSWFKALVNIISRSDLVVKELQLGCLKEGIDKYYDLGLSEKLSLLNFLCDEALGTKKLRSFIDDENLKYVEKRKQVKAKVAEATKKEQSLKRNLKDVMAKTTTSENGATLSTSEHDALLSEIRSEVAKAHAERVEAINTQLSFGNQISDALRVEPVFSNGSGQTLWRLNCYTTEYAFLMQDIKVEDAVDERWFVYGGENKEEMEKYIASSRSKRRKIRNDSRTFNTDSCEEHM